MNKTINLQDTFLNQARKEKVGVTVFLMNGVRMTGTVKGFDNFTVILECGRIQQAVYKHAISTIIPSKNINIFAAEEEVLETV